MYLVSVQGFDERMINVHYYYIIIYKRWCYCSDDVFGLLKNIKTFG